MNSYEKMKQIVTALNNKKAQDIEVIEVAEVSSLTDYFVICTGGSTTQLKALADEVEFKLKEQGETVYHTEGYTSALWILLDYSDVIVHVFHKESRMFYSLERLWADAKKIDISDLINE